jgi:hypothetical protein
MIVQHETNTFCRSGAENFFSALGTYRSGDVFHQQITVLDMEDFFYVFLMCLVATTNFTLEHG